jgi:hypothetical protein
MTHATAQPIVDESKVKELNRKQPILPIKDFEDVLIQLRPDLHCRTCYGRGYTSFSHDPKTGKQTMNLCGCATFGETEILKVLRAIGIISQQLDQMNGVFAEILIRIEKAQVDQIAMGKAIMGLLLMPSKIKQVINKVTSFLKGARQNVIQEIQPDEAPDSGCGKAVQD